MSKLWERERAIREASESNNDSVDDGGVGGRDGAHGEGNLGTVTNTNEVKVDMGNDKNAEAGASPSGQVAANSLVAGVRKSERIKITNSCWKDYV
ncbi:hypothetical protein SESBI_29807 [Sesbania bispinosa]|nr:hypothetical protein SESBI_29807 [Sesbania bispinosa]